MMGEAAKGVLTVVLFGALAAAGYFGARHWQDGEPAYARAEPDRPCDLRSGPCATGLGDAGGELRFVIEPRDIPLMRPLVLRVEVGGIAPAGVEVEIRGLNMDMGLNRTVLQDDGEGVWTGETILPICSQRRMEWEAAVRLQADSWLEIPFRFDTRRP